MDFITYGNVDIDKIYQKILGNQNYIGTETEQQVCWNSDFEVQTFSSCYHTCTLIS